MSASQPHEDDKSEEETPEETQIRWDAMMHDDDYSPEEQETMRRERAARLLRGQQDDKEFRRREQAQQIAKAYPKAHQFLIGELLHAGFHVKLGKTSRHKKHQ